MARVSCTDEVWAEFKHLAAADGWQPVNEYLGELVAKEVARHARLRARAADATAQKVLNALDEVKALRDDLEGITARLEELAAGSASATTPQMAEVTGAPARHPWDVPPTPEELAEWQARWKQRAAEGGPDWFTRRASAAGDDVPEWEP